MKTGRGGTQGCCLSPFCSNIYSLPYLTNKVLEGFGDFKIGGQIIHTLQYTDDVVLLAKKETVLQDMCDG